MPTTILTPAENRFLQLTYPALADPTLTQLMPQLRDHPTVKTNSDWLTTRAKQVVTASRVDWLVQGSLAWKLLARLPYAVNPSEQRSQWHHCALCHLPVRYEYHVVLRSDGREIVVGSECVKKFMSDEMQYLMTITTEQNFHAVAQYDALAARYPLVPEILWVADALPDLPAAHHAQRRWVKRGTRSTVTGYLEHRTTVLPERQLSPYLQGYADLQAKDQAAHAAIVARREQRVVQERTAAEQAQQAAWQAAASAQNTAEQQLRRSAPYRAWVTAVATVIVRREPLAAFKAAIATVTPPKAVSRLVNGYQLGVMASEFAHQGRIRAERLQIVPRYLVADLDRESQRLAAQRQRDWDDDVFNAAVGFDLPLAERQARLTQLRQGWEGRQLSADLVAELATLRARLTQERTLPATWPPALCQALRTRLAVQPADTWVPARKNHATPAQLHALVAPAPDFATVRVRFTRLYDLPPETAAVTLSALEQYYLQRRDRQAQRQAATQALVDQLFEND
ncbi:hypothetical protein [Levilactobacillus spicheri]|uniref:Uncharacterized protein n=1 Tax=Levilactobacillus spicheri TaxID=216463 RepID=A0A0F3RS57_9LACO|nr:hypothetical protein [Levilactobacillus spicheri]KJW12439.1 hypothetical protein VC81_08020 [Levilactobacillus spicheri]